ncbi:TetR/AcrR family transcriptional regulator [Dactylosporangium sucinum]|uniref:TetR family transcriptional regulator n=1 Tax=Dactylosporangium sucinum TaxID=1424081 RepID=A0A917WU79_9ACTN|nr:TetR/AcrR family transcriptional regulator [Dactylosporangium sucinum]GGM29097.1 TetR family transcriptional regulator [Dactylosporangium sucinum]
MPRLSRTDMQERNRARIVDAARLEFAERGYREARIDAIADRAELTRGAVYSNFPGKRALYFEVLAVDAATVAPPDRTSAATVRDALGNLAREWAARLPMATRTDASLLGLELMAEVAADQLTRLPFAQLKLLDAIVLGLALEHLEDLPVSRVRLAQAALTLLHGTAQLAAAAPGFGDPFDTVRACQALADLDLDHANRRRVHLDPAPAHRPDPAPRWWLPAADDHLGTGPLAPHDGIVAVLGLHRLANIEDALRAGHETTLAVVTDQPAELAPLARLSLAELRNHLRAAVPPDHWPALHVVVDDKGVLARGAGIDTVTDVTETALRVRDGRIVARADGWGACGSIAG